MKDLFEPGKLGIRLEEIRWIYKTSSDIICSVSDMGEFLTISKAAEHILGYEVAELIGRKYIDLVHPDDVKYTEKCEKELFSGKDTVFFENRYLCKDGSWAYISWKAGLSLDKRIAFAIATDITEKKFREKLQEKLTKELEETKGRINDSEK